MFDHHQNIQNHYHIATLAIHFPYLLLKLPNFRLVSVGFQELYLILSSFDYRLHFLYHFFRCGPHPQFYWFFFSNAFIRSTYHAFSLPSSLEHQVSNYFFVTSKPIFTPLQNLRYFVTVSVVSFVLPYFQTCHKEVVNTGLR